MIRGINNIPYLNLESYIDMQTFEELQPEILTGFALARNDAKEGTWMEPGFEQSTGSYNWHWKPIHQGIKDFFKMDDSDPVKIQGLKLYNEIKDHKTRNIFTRYMKMVTGAYDPYIYYFLWEEGSWDDRTAPRKLTPEAIHFPNTVKWIEKMIEDNIFEHIGRVIFFHCEADGVPFEHRDADAKNKILKEGEYTPHKNEFIHIRPNTKKAFYIWDPEKKNKIYLNTRAAWWNDQDWHGGERIVEQSYSLRIDGKFTESFREKLKINHLPHY